MKHLLLTLLALALTSSTFAGSILIEGFEYGNHDMSIPVGWTCNDQSWLSGYLDKDHNRTPHTGNWYAFTNAEDSWMFMPMYLSTQLKYRLTCWAISDGAYDLEFWAGNLADPEQMSQLIHSFPINHDEYVNCFTEFPTLTGDFQYIGIRAVAHEGAFHLTLDDLEIDMINRYDMMITPDYFDTVMSPGSRITIEFDVQNTGFEDLEVYMTPYSEYFTDIAFTQNGQQGSTFYTVPNQVVHCSCSATLSPSVAPGTRCWVDVMFTVSCDCITRLLTLWANAVDPTEIVEQKPAVRLFPNPAKGPVTIEGTGEVTVFNTLGQRVLSRRMDGKESFSLPIGLYIVRIESEDGIHSEKLIVE